MECTNQKCPHYLCQKGSNKKAFEHFAGEYTCKNCGHIVSRQWCGAKKAVEYDRSTKTMTVWHQGMHTCTLKTRDETREEKEKKKEVLKIILSKNPKATKNKIIDEGSKYFLLRGDARSAQNFVKACTDKQALNEVRKETMEDVIGLDMHSINAVAIVKKETDKVDPYHIFQINDRKMNNESSMVFKSSQVAAQLAIEMHNDSHSQNRNIPFNPMKDQVAYLDGMHSRVHGYVTLTLWVYSPVTLGVMQLAIMECEKEDANNISMFLYTFNKMLKQHTNIPDFTWNPRGFMCDENGANKIAIKRVLGENVARCTVSCQWHFMQCARRQLKNIKKENHEKFLQLAQKLTQCATKHDYLLITKDMQAICEHNQWFEWWHARHYHFVPVYRGFWLSGLNLAEVGHSMLKFQQGYSKISLVDAAFKDIAFQLRQDEKYTALINNEESHVGSGLNYNKLVEKAHKAQVARAHDYTNALKHGDAWMEAESVLEDPAAFEPNEMDKHHYVHGNSGRSGPRKPSKTTSVNKQAKKRKCASTQVRHNTSTQEVVEPNASAQKVQGISGFGQDAPNCNEPDLVPQNLEDALLKTRIPCVLMYNKSFKRCNSCGYEWDITYMDEPHNLLFRMKTFRKYKNKENEIVTNRFLSNAYYCIQNLDCLQKYLPGVKPQHIYMGNLHFNQMTHGHVQLLQGYGYWEYILNNRAKLRNDGLKAFNVKTKNLTKELN